MKIKGFIILYKKGWKRISTMVKVNTLGLQISFSKEIQKYNNSYAETLKFTLTECLTVMIVCPVIDDSHDRVSECSMMHSNCLAVKPFFVFHTYCSIIGRSIIRRSINCHIYALSYLLNVASLFCHSMFCRTSPITLAKSLSVASFLIS